MARCETTRSTAGERSGSARAAARNPRGSGGSCRSQSPTCRRWRYGPAAARTPTSRCCGCRPRPGGRRWWSPTESRRESSRDGSLFFDLGWRNVLPSHGLLTLEVEDEHARLVDGLPIHLALVVRAAVEHDPGGLKWICVADDGHGVAWVLAHDPAHHAEDAVAHLLDRFVAGHQAAPGLVHEPQRPPHRDLPVGQALQVPAELGLAQLRFRLEDRGRLEPGVDDLDRLD